MRNGIAIGSGGRRGCKNLVCIGGAFGTGLAVRVGVALRVEVRLGVRVGLVPGVPVRVAGGALGVRVGVGVAVEPTGGVPVEVGVALGWGPVGVRVTVGVAVTVPVGVGVGVRLAVEVRVEVGVRVGVAVGPLIETDAPEPVPGIVAGPREGGPGWYALTRLVGVTASGALPLASVVKESTATETRPVGALGDVWEATTFTEPFAFADVTFV